MTLPSVQPTRTRSTQFVIRVLFPVVSLLIVGSPTQTLGTLRLMFLMVQRCLFVHLLQQRWNQILTLAISGSRHVNGTALAGPIGVASTVLQVPPKNLLN